MNMGTTPILAAQTAPTTPDSMASPPPLDIPLSERRPPGKRQRVGSQDDSDDGGDYGQPAERRAVFAPKLIEAYTQTPPRPKTSGRIREPPSLDSIRDTINQQFDVEIVLKHRELRLIENELAKVQISMEQLRRCTILDYSKSAEAQLANVYPHSFPHHGLPEFAPPDGLVDGPYTRHYKQWLLPDRSFDSSIPAVRQPVLDLSSSRPQRTTALKAQSRSGDIFCLHRRQRDGLLVKLICITCKKTNFQNAQGFINHCRISHKIEYASHEDAAEACGVPVDDGNEFVTPVTRNPLDGPARNTRAFAAPPAWTPAPAPQREVVVKAESNNARRSRRPASGMTIAPSPTTQKKEATPKKRLNRGSAQIGNLASLLQSRQMPVNLQSVVNDILPATSREATVEPENDWPELDVSSSDDDDEDESDVSLPLASPITPGNTTARKSAGPSSMGGFSYGLDGVSDRKPAGFAVEPVIANEDDEDLYSLPPPARPRTLSFSGASASGGGSINPASLFKQEKDTEMPDVGVETMGMEALMQQLPGLSASYGNAYPGTGYTLPQEKDSAVNGWKDGVLGGYVVGK